MSSLSRAVVKKKKKKGFWNQITWEQICRSSQSSVIAQVASVSLSFLLYKVMMMMMMIIMRTSVVMEIRRVCVCVTVDNLWEMVRKC